MKKIHVKVKIINDLKEEIFTDVMGEYIEDENLISYYDKNVLVRVIIENKIIMQREHPGYNFDLIFEKNKKNKSVYKIYNPKMDLDLEVDTKVLRKGEKSFHIEYGLKMGNEDMGLFSIDFKWEE